MNRFPATASPTRNAPCRERRMWLCLIALAWGVSPVVSDGAETPGVEVPAFTAYLDPDRGGARVDARRGITRWVSKDVTIQVYVNLKATGRLSLQLLMSLPDSQSSAIRVSVAGKEFVAEVAKPNGRDKFVQVPVGSAEISKPGYYRVILKGLRRRGPTFGNLKSLVFSGPAAKGMHFNTKPRRNAASVHLWYPIPKAQQVEWFYNEVTVPRGADPVHSFYMACGFARGYFGIQVNSPTERRVIFSVWDSGNEGVDRKKVKDADRVKLLAKGKGVVAHGFGNEGTGGHSHWVHSWKTAATHRFLLHAQPDRASTTYTAYFYLAGQRKWKLVASFRAPKDGKQLRGLYSFIENFGGSSGQLPRKALFSRQWVRTNRGEWLELTRSRFTHDPTGKVERRDYGGGAEAAGFSLFNGGFVPGTAKYGDAFRRKATSRPPQVGLPFHKADLAD